MWSEVFLWLVIWSSINVGLFSLDTVDRIFSTTLLCFSINDPDFEWLKLIIIYEMWPSCPHISHIFPVAQDIIIVILYIVALIDGCLSFILKIFLDILFPLILLFMFIARTKMVAACIISLSSLCQSEIMFPHLVIIVHDEVVEFIRYIGYLQFPPHPIWVRGSLKRFFGITRRIPNYPRSL